MHRSLLVPERGEARRSVAGTLSSTGCLRWIYIATLTEWEDPDEYQNLLDRLAEDYRPVGAAEELEVQRIASCWWKLSRVWRYENAKIAGKLCARYVEFNKVEKIPAEDKARLTLLANARS